MAKNTGMTEKDVKAGKAPGLNGAQATEVNKKLKKEQDAPPPTKTVAMVDKARGKKVDQSAGTLLLHKPVSKKP
jgi:hypothetical protein